MILKLILTNITLLPDESWQSSVISLILIFGFFMIINSIFQAEKKVYFEQQSRIPLNDDTPIEKRLLAQQNKNNLNYDRLDA
mgnify:CR=1 FL=1|tara:strand:+ start:48528 stop:48773 length:246 start_codon:yes stop_codon:yes gene_type:complete